MTLQCSIFRLLVIALAAVTAGAAVGQPARGFNELGVMAFQAKKFPIAQDYLEKALALEPDNRKIRNNLCAVHQAIANKLADAGNFADAVDRALLAVAVDPENASPLAQAGAYRFRLGQVAEAAAHLEAALALDPAFIDAHFLLGEVYYQQNRLDDARMHWKRVLEADPDRAGLQEKLAKLDRESTVEEGFNEYAEGQFRLSYAKALSEDTRALVFRILEDARSDTGAKLGDLFPPAPVQVVLYDGDQFTEATGLSAHVGALYDGKIRAPITGRNGRFLDERTLRVRLTHEYVHVVLVQNIGVHLPWWINEGLAEVFSREMDLSRKRLLRGAYSGDRAYPLRDLGGRDVQELDPKALSVAYAQAHAAADYLWKSGGTKKLVALLGQLKTGTPPEDALHTAYDLDYAALDTAVADAYK